MSEKIKEISIIEIDGIAIGHAQNHEAKTGVTVIYFENGAKVGCDISGGGPASRETPLTDPLTAENPVNAIVLSGGSAFGLAAGDGVMCCLEDNKIGLNTGNAIVPLVCQSCIYDLGYGRSDVRPDAAMGYEACQNALSAATAEKVGDTGTDTTDIMGNIGAGTGATVGKLLGMAQAQKTGLGIHAVQVGQLKIGAIVALNACGDIFDPKTGQKIAGLMDKERKCFIDSESAMLDMSNEEKMASASAVTNTTIGCIITNADFDKAGMSKIASMTRSAYSRCIDPVGMMWDGDTIYAASIGAPSTDGIKYDMGLVGSLAAKVMQEAIIKAVRSAQIDDREFRKYAGV